jgi:hypothetical protein
MSILQPPRSHTPSDCNPRTCAGGPWGPGTGTSHTLSSATSHGSHVATLTCWTGLILMPVPGELIALSTEVPRHSSCLQYFVCKICKLIGREDST